MAQYWRVRPDQKKKKTSIVLGGDLEESFLSLLSSRVLQLRLIDTRSEEEEEKEADGRRYTKEYNKNSGPGLISIDSG
jgi:hypothetical protein